MNTSLSDYILYDEISRWDKVSLMIKISRTGVEKYLECPINFYFFDKENSYGFKSQKENCFV